MRFILVILVPTQLLLTSATFCDFPGSVKVKYEGEDDYVASSCVQSRFFSQEITEAIISGNISYIGPGSVQNMLILEKIVIMSKNLRLIDPGAFENCPKLNTITIYESDMEDILRGIFNSTPSLENLMITDSDVDYIESFAFGDLPNLKSVMITHSQLAYWDKDWFRGSTNVNEMYFNNNQIRSLSRQAFSRFPIIEVIDFNHNEITQIHREAFKGVTNLKTLNLSFNKLTVINPNIFTDDIKIGSFLIFGNYLNFLGKDLTKKLTVDELTMDLNPWICACLKSINLWLFKNNSSTSLITRKCREQEEIPICATYEEIEGCPEEFSEEITNIFLKGLPSNCRIMKEYWLYNAAEVFLPEHIRELYDL